MSLYVEECALWVCFQTTWATPSSLSFLYIFGVGDLSPTDPSVYIPLTGILFTALTNSTPRRPSSPSPSLYSCHCHPHPHPHPNPSSPNSHHQTFITNYIPTRTSPSTQAISTAFQLHQMRDHPSGNPYTRLILPKYLSALPPIKNIFIHYTCEETQHIIPISSKRWICMEEFRPCFGVWEWGLRLCSWGGGSCVMISMTK